MFEKSNRGMQTISHIARSNVNSNDKQKEFSLCETNIQTMDKECTDIIEDAFNPIKCTTWQSKKNLVDRIEEDHPTHKSIEYNIEEKKIVLPPIGRGLKEKGKRHILLNSIKIDSFSSGSSEEPQKEQFFEEVLAFAKKRGITSSENLICAISKDQEGSRFIQKKLDSATIEEIDITFEEICPWISELIVDLFGNYVVQKFLEIGTTEQREKIFFAMESTIISLALHMYGCRVIQKALECKDINRKIVEKSKGMLSI